MSETIDPNLTVQVSVRPVAVCDRPAPVVEADPALDIDRSAQSRRVLPDALYTERTRALRVSEITATMVNTFLEELCKTGLWELSARRVGLNLRHIKKIMRIDDDFKAWCEDAIAAHVDGIEAEAYRRAKEGYDEAVFSHKDGRLVGHIRKYDSQLMQMFLRRHDRGDKPKSETEKNSGGVLIITSPGPVAVMSTEQLQAQFNSPAPAKQLTEQDTKPESA